MPEKLIFFFQRAPQLSREEFCRRYLEVHAPLVVQRFPRLRGFVVNLNIGREEPGDPTDVFAEADAITEFWFDSFDDFADLSRRYDSPEGREAVESDWQALTGSTIGYRVVERVERDNERSWALGERSPGMKMIAALRRAPGLTHEQFVDHWLNTHVPLALEHVLGMWRYVTNVVAAPLWPGAPDIDGIVEVHYLEKRRFDSPEGEAIMNADVAQFLSPPLRIRTNEYVLLG